MTYDPHPDDVQTGMEVLTYCMGNSGTVDWQESTVREILATVVPDMLKRVADEYDEAADSYPAALAGHGRNRLIASAFRKVYQSE